MSVATTPSSPLPVASAEVSRHDRALPTEITTPCHQSGVQVVAERGHSGSDSECREVGEAGQPTVFVFPAHTAPSVALHAKGWRASGGR
jgi:hypothetical protein